MGENKTKSKRTQRFLAKQMKSGAKGWDYSSAPDLRQQSKVAHPMDAIHWAIELGLTSNQPSLRDVEEMTTQLGTWAKKLVPASISDTTLDTEIQRLDPCYLHDLLVQRVRGFARSKMLQPVDLPCGVATVDGKNLATLDNDADGTGHKRCKKNEKWHRSKGEEAKRGDSYFLMPALRVTLTSAESKPCIYQLPLPQGTGESTMFPEMFSGLKRAYGHGDMFRIIDTDAGLTSLRNANVVVDGGYDYVFGLKGNQQELFAEAEALLLPLAKKKKPAFETQWEHREGIQIRRQLWRTGEMAGIENSVGTWSHLRQTWLVRQQTKGSGGKITVEDRIFVTSLDWGFLKPEQIIVLVRNHWGIEAAFNALDMQWREDSGAWCTRGTAVWALGILRMMAYNTAQILRRRRLRKKKKDGTRADPISWRCLFKTIEKSFEFDAGVSCTG